MLDYSWSQPPNDYPTSDDLPMGETELHRDLFTDCVKTLQAFFAADPIVHVTGNMLWFYRKNDKRRHLTPDVMVIFGVPKGRRKNYLQWEEGNSPQDFDGPGTTPQVVIELTSNTTRKEYMGHKRALYEKLQVGEYYLFDPRAEYLSPRLRTYHLRAGKFAPVLGEKFFSPRLGLEPYGEGDQLRFRDPKSRRVLLTEEERVEEQIIGSREEAERADREARRADQEAARAEQESARAKQESARAEKELALRRAAELELAELRHALRKLQAAD